MNKCTPGPWDYWHDPISGLFRIRKDLGNNRQIIGHIAREKDARLVVAAPEMLAELRNLIECLELAERNDDISLPFAGYGRIHIDRAKVTIAKAEGHAEGAVP